MKITMRRLALAMASASVLGIYGCGGGGGGGVATDSVGVTVIDGAIRNALVCLDKNLNGACDSDEPGGRTDAAGKVTLTVNKADTGKYPILAVVGTDAIDADTGAVPVAFTLKAPADRTAVVSPLTTLVQTLMEGSGLSSTAAAAQLKDTAGIGLSLFDDFTAGSSSDHKAAGALARLIVVTTQQQTTALKSSIDTAALDGSTITKEKLDKAIQKKLIERLSAIAAALPAVLAAAPADREAAISGQAGTLVAGNELTTQTIGTVVAINNQGAPGNTATALEQAQAFLNLFSASYATSVPNLDALDNAFLDACYLDGGDTLATLKAARARDPVTWDAFRRYQIGSTRTGLQVVADRSVTNADGSTRRELDLKYNVNYADGTAFTYTSTTEVSTIISGSSSGSAMANGTACSKPQAANAWRFLGDRRIVAAAMRPYNTRNERYSLATGDALGTPVDYSKWVHVRMADPSNVAKYMVVTGPGLPASGVKMLSPRLLRDDPLLAGKVGNNVDWLDRDNFRFCRDSGNSSAASTADCLGVGANGNSRGAFNRTAAQADAEFDAQGYVAGGSYVVKVHNDDGWKTVGGHVAQTPLATYTTELRRLPYSAVALAGTDPANDLYPHLSTSLSKVAIASAIRTNAAYNTDLSFTAVGTLPDGAKYGWGDIYHYVQGDVTTTAFGWPRSRQTLLDIVPAVGATSFAGFNVPAASSVLLTPRYAEITLSLSDRKRSWVQSLLQFD